VLTSELEIGLGTNSNWIWPLGVTPKGVTRLGIIQILDQGISPFKLMIPQFIFQFYSKSSYKLGKDLGVTLYA